MIWLGKSFIKFCKSFINLIKLVSTRTCSLARVRLVGLFDVDEFMQPLVIRCEQVYSSVNCVGGNSLSNSRSKGEPCGLAQAVWRVFLQGREAMLGQTFSHDLAALHKGGRQLVIQCGKCLGRPKCIQLTQPECAAWPHAGRQDWSSACP